MSEFRVIRRYPHPPETVWRAVTDPALVPRWTSTGRGGRPEGFDPVPGVRFRLVGKPVPGWDGVVECEVTEVCPPSLLRYSWAARGDKHPTQVTYRIDPEASGTRFTFEHAGFRGVGGFLLAKLVLGPVRRRMLDVGLPTVLQSIDTANKPPTAA